MKIPKSHKNKMCPCGQESVTFLDKCPCCQDCYDIEKNLYNHNHQRKEKPPLKHSTTWCQENTDAYIYKR